MDFALGDPACSVAWRSVSTLDRRLLFLRGSARIFLRGILYIASLNGFALAFFAKQGVGEFQRNVMMLCWRLDIPCRNRDQVMALCEAVGRLLLKLMMMLMSCSLTIPPFVPVPLFASFHQNPNLSSFLIRFQATSFLASSVDQSSLVRIAVRTLYNRASLGSQKSPELSSRERCCYRVLESLRGYSAVGVKSASVFAFSISNANINVHIWKTI